MSLSTINNKFYRLTHIRAWLNSEGISGIQVKFDTLSGITGFPWKTFIYGEPHVLDEI